MESEPARISSIARRRAPARVAPQRSSGDPGSPVWPTLLKLAAVASWIVLALLSTVPGVYRPHIVVSGNIEHALAYGLSAFVTRMAFRTTPSRFQVCAFSIAAGLFEILQIWIPGRSAALENWIASAAGALAGLVAGRTIAHRGRGYTLEFARLRRHRPSFKTGRAARPRSAPIVIDPPTPS